MTPPAQDPSAFAAHLAELTFTESVFEAEQLAARLRANGIIAIANARLVREDRGQERMRGFVLVATIDLEGAQALLAADLPPEGPVSSEEIVREMAAMDDDALDEFCRESRFARFEPTCKRGLVWTCRSLVLLIAGLTVWFVVRALR